VQHRCNADPRAEMLWIGGDSDNGIRARAHQKIVDLAFVLVGDVGNLFGQSKDQVEIPHGQQLCFARGQPCLCRACLTFWAMTIAA